MIKMNSISTRSSLCRTALFALGCALSLVVIPTTSLKAEPAVAQKSLPLKHAFEKVAGEKGPFELKLTNTSKDSVKITVQVCALPGSSPDQA